MSLQQRLTDDMKTAMKAGDKDTLGVVRRAIAAMQNARIEKREDLDEQEEIKVIRSIAKQHKESIEQFRAAGREDLATKEEAELEILSTYLPAEMDQAQLEALVDAAIAESGAS
ncbi:MAG: GatB/YqeY domain-containing protein, partial [Thermoleophilia bacterium]